ncbi:MAG TPA: ATP-binding protein [Pseudonocardia sp.]|nr:ATP-binding protein [Pseudonocardia sp.]
MRCSFRLVLVADRGAAPRVRRALQCWLRDRGWPPGERDDVVLAVDEAVTNVVEHAYPDGATGSASVTAGLATTPEGRTQVVLVVTDHGVWHTLGVRPHRPTGLRLMRACTQSVRIRPTLTGTTIMMASRPIRLAAAPSIG